MKLTIQEEPIYTASEYDSWGWKMLFNGFLVGFGLGALLFSLGSMR